MPTETKPKWTSGQWCQDTYLDAPRDIVSEINGVRVLVATAYVSDQVSEGEAIANATLMAAAKDLYEALRDALIFIAESRCSNLSDLEGNELSKADALRACSAALRRAEGVA